MAPAIRLLCLFLLGCLVRADDDTEKPNFLVIIADDLGFADVGWHGSVQMNTSNLDALAKQSTVLTRHYVQSVCTPSRAALMTGYYPIRNGLQHMTIQAAQPYGLPLNFSTMPQILREKAGYKTHLVGKWHLGYFKKEYTPTFRGFDTFFGFYGGMEGFYDHGINKNGFYGIDFNENEGTTVKTTPEYFGQYSDDLFGDRASKIIKDHDISNPLFLYLAFQGVHDPLEGKSDLNKEFPHIYKWHRRQHAMQLKALDNNVGKVIAALEERSMLDNTYILFASDNGGSSVSPHNEGSNYPLRGMKTYEFEGGVRVPAFIKGPGIPEQVTYDNYVHISDWLPTFYSAIGENVTDLGEIDGIDQLKAIQKTAKKGPRDEILLKIDPVYKEKAIISGEYKLYLTENGLHAIVDDKLAKIAIQSGVEPIRDGWYYDSGPLGQNNTVRQDSILGGWKLPIVVCNDTLDIGRSCNLRAANSSCLFNIIEDPCEYNNIADDHPDIVARLMERIEFYEESMVEAQDPPADPMANPELPGRNGFWEPWQDDV